MKSSLNLHIQQLLKNSKLYSTKCRVEILKVLFKAKKPLRQDQIARRLGKNRSHKVTIYRTLESLCSIGLVHKAFIQKRTWHFELSRHCTETQCHPHFTCTSCGKTTCMTEMILPPAKSPYRGFVIHRQQVRLEGLCPVCS